MHESFQYSSYLRLKSEMAAYRMRRAARRFQHVLKYNPNWHLQPRVPAGNRDGGWWLPFVGAVSSLLPALQRLGPGCGMRFNRSDLFLSGAQNVG